MRLVQYGEKCAHFFPDCEKSRAAQNAIRNIAKDEKNLHVISELIKKLDLNKNLFSENLNVSKNEIIKY